MKLSNVFALCAVVLWGAHSHAVNIAGREVDADAYPKTVKEMTEFNETLLPKMVKIIRVMDDHAIFLETARAKAFPEGDPKPAVQAFLKDARENYESLEKIDLKAWNALPSTQNDDNFSQFIHRLKQANSCLHNIVRESVDMSMAIEDRAKESSFTLSPTPQSWIMQDPLNLFKGDTRDTFRSEVNRIADMSKDCKNGPYCQPGSALEAWLIETKNMHHEDFITLNGVISAMVSDFFRSEVSQPLAGHLSVVATNTSK